MAAAAAVGVAAAEMAVAAGECAEELPVTRRGVEAAMCAFGDVLAIELEVY